MVIDLKNNWLIAFTFTDLCSSLLKFTFEYDNITKSRTNKIL